MNKRILHTGLLVLALVVVTLLVSGEARVSAEDATEIMADFPPLYTPPTEIEGCYVYDICLMYRWKEPPCGGKRVFYEKGWSGQAVLVEDAEGNIFYAMRESFGMGCPEH